MSFTRALSKPGNVPFTHISLSLSSFSDFPFLLSQLPAAVNSAARCVVPLKHIKGRGCFPHCGHKICLFGVVGYCLSAGRSCTVRCVDSRQWLYAFWCSFPQLWTWRVVRNCFGWAFSNSVATGVECCKMCGFCYVLDAFWTCFSQWLGIL